MTKRKLAALVSAGVVLVGAAAALILPAQLRKNQLSEVSTVAAHIGDLEQWLNTTGTVRAGTEKTYAAPVGLSIREALVEPGDRVTAGQMLATLETAAYENTVEQAKSAYEKAADAVRQVRDAQAQAEEETETLRQEIAALEQELCQQTEQDKAQREQLYREIVEKIQAGETLSQEDLSALLQPSSENSLSEKLISLLTKQVQLYMLQSQSSSLTGSTVTQLESAAETAKAAYDTAREMLMEYEKGLVAEFDGIVASVSTTTSLTGSAGIVVKSDKGLYAEIALGKYDINRVQPGQEARISATGGEFTGTVDRVSSIAQTTASLTGTSTTTVTARIAIEGDTTGLLIDYECNVDILLGTETNAVLVPVEAVRTDNGGSYCFVVKDGVLHRTGIETGCSSDTYIAVTSGLSAGDTVVGNPSGELADGQTVTAKAAA